MEFGEKSEILLTGSIPAARTTRQACSWQAREVRYGTGRNPIHSGYLLEANKTLELTPGAVPSVNAHRIIGDVRKRMNPGHDVLRHTFISMLVGAFKSVGDAATLRAGNSEAVIRKHYLDLKTEEEARAFLGNLAEGMRLPVNAEKKELSSTKTS